jgi:transglutaminase superfamily protein
VPRDAVQPTGQYLLPHHVFVRVTADAAIFLDVRTNSYVGLGAEHSAALAPLVRGWPLVGRTGTVTAEDARVVAGNLEKRGLLVTEAIGGKPAVPTPVTVARHMLLAWDEMRWQHIRPRHVMRFLLAFSWSRRCVRHRRFADVVQEVRTSAAAARSSSPELDRLRDAMSAFYHIRPFFYSYGGQCLLDSLTLFRFLSLHHIGATWVIGIRTRPFAAHTWLQYESYVLNDMPEDILSYAPIMAI